MEHKTISIADQVFERLEHDILLGEYRRGDILTEIKLGEKFGVSRTPIREALSRLEQEHIIEITARGAYVLGIQLEDISDIFEIRVRIEALAARYATERMSDEDIAELREIVDLQDFYAAKGDTDNVKNLDSRFHNMVYEKCGSVTFCDTLKPLLKRITKYRRSSLADPARAKASMAEHKAIVEAMALRDLAEVERLTNMHVINARNSILAKERD